MGVHADVCRADRGGAGPSGLFVISRALVLGRRGAQPTVLDYSAGLLVQVLVVAVGVGELVERSVVVFNIIKLGGAAYLCLSGVESGPPRRIAPQFVDRSAGRLPLQLFLLGTVFMLIAVVLDSMWAMSAGSARDWLAQSPARLSPLGATGPLLMGIGARLALTVRHD